MKMTRKEFIRLSAGGAAGLSALGSGILSGCSRIRQQAGELTAEIMRLNLVNTWTIARNSSDFKSNIIVKYKKDGITGFGEAAPNVRYNETPESTLETIERAKPLFESGNPLHYVDLGLAVQAVTKEQTAAKCALDTALMDWICKKLSVPMYRFYGLDRTRTPLTSFSIGIDTPEIIQKKIREAAVYPVLKIKLGKDDDEAIMRTVREVTNKTVRVDINEGWKDPREALEKIHWLKSLNVEFVEQPMPSDMLDETRWLREHSPLPIIADEAVKCAADIPKLAAAYDGINIKLMKSGGVQEALRMIWMARSLGLKIMLGCMIESGCAIAAAAAVSPLADWADLDGNLLISNDPFDGVQVDDGKLILSDRPGLGIKEIRQ